MAQRASLLSSAGEAELCVRTAATSRCCSSRDPIFRQNRSCHLKGKTVLLNPVRFSEPNPRALKTAARAASAPRSSFANKSGAKNKSTVSEGKQRKLTIAVDVDEVLGSFLKTLNKFCAEEYSLHHEVSEFYVYDFMKIWKCSQLEANERVHAFFESDHFNDGIPIIPGAYETLSSLKCQSNLVVVTSRQHVIRDHTLEWIERHFPQIFSQVRFGNHFALAGKAVPKSEICRSIGADILIDDNPYYALECATHGIHVLLFDYQGKYAWSKIPTGRNDETDREREGYMVGMGASHSQECPEYSLTGNTSREGILGTSYTGNGIKLPDHFEVGNGKGVQKILTGSEGGSACVVEESDAGVPISKRTGEPAFGPFHPLIQRVRDWREVESAIEKLRSEDHVLIPL